jgi:hypothetical protein
MSAQEKMRSRALASIECALLLVSLSGAASHSSSLSDHADLNNQPAGVHRQPSRAGDDSAKLHRSDGTLPVGKTVSLPPDCIEADQNAVRRLERHGELLDLEPTLFAEAYNTLIKARIACRAGSVTAALNFYDEIEESLREKVVPNDAALTAGR